MHSHLLNYNSPALLPVACRLWSRSSSESSESSRNRYPDSRGIIPAQEFPECCPGQYPSSTSLSGELCSRHRCQLAQDMTIFSRQTVRLLFASWLLQQCHRDKSLSVCPVYCHRVLDCIRLFSPVRSGCNGHSGLVHLAHKPLLPQRVPPLLPLKSAILTGRHRPNLQHQSSNTKR